MRWAFPIQPSAVGSVKIASRTEHQAWYKADDIYAAIERVPSAQPVAKDINVPVKDCISRQAAIDALWKVKDEQDSVYYTSAIHTAVETLEQLPSAQPEQPTCQLLEDGTLIVEVPNIYEVHRVIVDEENSHYCKTFYQDGDHEKAD